VSFGAAHFGPEVGAMRKFILELRRRNFVNVGTAYVIVAWALMQGEFLATLDE
jgi:hypothetical protein